MTGSAPGAFATLSLARCHELLRTRDIARVAWQAVDGLQILPVTYAWYQDAVVFRTSPYGVLSELIQPTEVAVEIDDLHQEQRSGWSVVVRGRAEAIAEPRELVQLWTVDGLVPWAPGVRNLFIRVQPQQISGRQLQSAAEESTDR